MNSLPVAPPVTEYLYRKAAGAGVPLSGTFELTPFCNMDCKMCYVRLDKKAVSHPLADAEMWLSLAQKARDLGMLYLLVTGGEPFSHPQIREILEGLHKMGLLVSVNSNGTLIDEETVRWLKNCPPLRVNISIYGASNETYSRLCGNKKGFTQVCNAISLLTEAGISVKLNCSLTPENAGDLESVVAFAKEGKLPLQVATYMFPPVRKNAEMVGKNQRFTPQEAAKYMFLSEKLLTGEGGMEAVPTTPDWDENCAGLGDESRCRAGKCSFWITWKGDMTPCGMFPTDDSGNVFENDFSEVWEQTKKQVASIRLPALCAGCQAKNVCRACAAMVITESRNFSEVPKYRCQMMRNYFEICKEDKKNEK